MTNPNLGRESKSLKTKTIHNIKNNHTKTMSGNNLVKKN